MRPGALFACLLTGVLFTGEQLSAGVPLSRPIAIVVGAGDRLVVHKSDLALVFRRKKLFWDDGRKAQPVNLPAADPMRQDFSQVVLGASPEDLEKYWNDMYFHGISPPYVLSSEEAVVRFVAKTPGAIGYVSYCGVDARVSVVLVINAQGRLSDDISSVKCVR